MRTLPLLAALLAATAAPAFAADATEPAFRALYKELVETNTVVNEGSCTKAAGQIAARMKAAGFTDDQLVQFAVPEHPQDGGLVAILPGTDKRSKPILLLAHIDVVAAKREDWQQDPFTLVEKDGYFIARGVADDKAMAAVFADSLIRLKQSGPKLRRTVKLALTCGEETSGAFNGAEWLANNRRELIDAEFALNEGGGGRPKPDGTPELLALQVGEKHYQDFEVTATNPGGHSSRPVPDNAIYDLATALKAVQAYKFPARLNDTTRAFFTAVAPTQPAPVGAAMLAIAKNEKDEAAAALLSGDPMMNAMLRTTCVATQVSAGHAQNALPQRATANVNCRIIPGETVETTLAALQTAINDPAIKVAPKISRNKIAIQPPMSAAVVEPARAVAKKHFPGVPVLPTMVVGATDGPFLSAAGIPVYGVPGILYEADGGGVHGLNERIRVSSVLNGRAYLHDLIIAYAK
ncbi:M20/M25/M40 family metallo-hydrolase [Sandaracinobacter neustonicus]|uniref:M20/M25/M40 family metallo-hydrolase n=1 Tax=Sandaracinobacter neustonicus TaxID=1715348 RepID=A0A501XND1_9SPHN|nr:M20/M25/M40 family metallo-hydrolase [Sandaracinobacter neustonicus]TPE61794.1 M20/M25/M40 family metallo-hydrolase [Sandaracinobacter neustonicus]